MEMDLAEISNRRLHNQLLVEPKFDTAKEVVAWMGAMQAQNYQMAKWAIGARLARATDTIVESAINRGEIIRTHVLRPTWHVVSADDMSWMLDLTASHIKSSLQARHRKLEITEDVVKDSITIIENALGNSNHLTREELLTELQNAHIATEQNRGYHLLLRAEVDGIICSGKTTDRTPTYALLAERVPRKHVYSQDDALGRLAQKYFSSHAPATLQDFTWWSGLPARLAKRALEMVQSNFISETVDAKTYWFPDSRFSSTTAVYLLPAYDEFLIGYKDKTVSLPFEDQRNNVHTNGVFRPIIVINGNISGIWKLTTRRNKVMVETNLFQPVEENTRKAIEKRAEMLGQFMGQTLEIVV